MKVVCSICKLGLGSCILFISCSFSPSEQDESGGDVKWAVFCPLLPWNQNPNLFSVRQELSVNLKISAFTRVLSIFLYIFTAFSHDSGRCLGTALFGLGWLSLAVLCWFVSSFLARLFVEVLSIKPEDLPVLLFKAIFWSVSWIGKVRNILIASLCVGRGLMFTLVPLKFGLKML